MNTQLVKLVSNTLFLDTFNLLKIKFLNKKKYET